MDPRDPRIVASIAGVLLVLALMVWLLICINRNRRNHKARQAQHQQAYQARINQLKSLLERALANDLAACDELIQNRYNGENWQNLAYNASKKLSELFNDAVNNAERLLNYVRQHTKAAKALSDSMRGDMEQRVKGLTEYLRALENCTHDNAERIARDHDLTAARALELLDQAIKFNYEELLQKARNGDEKALLLLDVLITDTQNTSRSDNSDRPFYKLGVVELQRPDDWNELVATLVHNPGLRLFQTKCNVTFGDVLHMAAEAERTGDLVTALMVLAYWNAGRRYKEEIPDELITSLIRMVVRHRANATQTAS